MSGHIFAEENTGPELRGTVDLRFSALDWFGSKARFFLSILAWFPQVFPVLQGKS